MDLYTFVLLVLTWIRRLDSGNYGVTYRKWHGEVELWWCLLFKQWVSMLSVLGQPTDWIKGMHLLLTVIWMADVDQLQPVARTMRSNFEWLHKGLWYCNKARFFSHQYVLESSLQNLFTVLSQLFGYFCRQKAVTEPLMFNNTFLGLIAVQTWDGSVKRL